jgi:hypothetical protein
MTINKITQRLNFPFPRKRRLLFCAVVLIGISGAFLAYHLMKSPPDNLMKSPSEKAKLLTESQTKTFESALAQPKVSLKNPHRLRVIYTPDCAVCNKNALDVLTIINKTSGWQVTSLSSPKEGASRQGVILEISKKDAVSTEGVAALESALKSANIPFTTEETKSKYDEDFILFFGP